MRSHLAAFIAVFVLLLSGSARAASPAGTLPERPTAQVFLSAVSSTGASGYWVNTDYAAHVLWWTTTGLPNSVQIELDGSQDGKNWTAISTVGTGTTGAVFAAGFFLYVRANLLALAGGTNPTLTATYGGAPSGSPANAGATPATVTANQGTPNAGGALAWPIEGAEIEGNVPTQPPVQVAGKDTVSNALDDIPVATSGTERGVQISGLDSSVNAEILHTAAGAGNVNNGALNTLDACEGAIATTAPAYITFTAGNACTTNGLTATGTSCTLNQAAAAAFVQDGCLRLTCTVDVNVLPGSATSTTANQYSGWLWAKTIDSAPYMESTPYVSVYSAASGGSCSITELQKVP